MTVVVICLFIVEQAKHVQIVVFKTVLASAVEENLSHIGHSKQLNQVGGCDLQLGDREVLTVSFQY